MERLAGWGDWPSSFCGCVDFELEFAVVVYCAVFAL